MKRRNAHGIVFVVVFITVVMAARGRVLGQSVVYVDSDAPGTNNGTSWGSAYNFLQDALGKAYSLEKPVVVRVAEGIYTPDSSLATPGGTGDRRATFQLADGITLEGGYAGFGETEPDTRDIGEYETILSGDLHGDDIYTSDPQLLWTEPTRAENSYHVVSGGGADLSAILDGFTVTAGHADGTPGIAGSGYGGGMLNRQGSPTVMNCTFAENTCAMSGAGMDNESYSMPTITMCTFYRNCSLDRGGGMSNYRSAPILTDCAFIENRAFGGAGMDNDFATGLAPTLLTRCSFINNRAERFGAGLYNGSSNPTLTNCLFVGNSVESFQSGRGGAIANYKSSPALYNCTLAENRAPRRGAAMENLNCNPSLLNCIVWNNQAGWEEGAITGGQDVWIDFSNVQGGWPGQDNVNVDPCFARPGQWDPNGTPDDANDDFWLAGDYHLKSSAGRWNPDSHKWVYDHVTSQCIDTGYYDQPTGEEPAPNGNVINMGFYGGTSRASMSLCPAGHPADCDASGAIDILDLLRLGEQWLAQGDSLIEDINRDGIVNFADFAVLTSNWMASTGASCQSGVFSESFETDDWYNQWIDGNQQVWQVSADRAPDGNNSVAVMGPAQNGVLTSTPIHIVDEDRQCAIITFGWYVMDLVSGDYLAFEVSTDQGVTWQEEARFEGYGTQEGSSQDVRVKLRDITDLQLRFRANVTDSNGKAYLDAINVVTSFH